MNVKETIRKKDEGISWNSFNRSTGKMEKKLTAAIEGFFPSPAGGCVTSAPKKITGD